MTLGGVQIWFAIMLAMAGILMLAAIASRQLFYLVAAVCLAGTSAQLGMTDPEWFGSLQLSPNPFSHLCFAVIALQGGIVATVLLTGGRLATMRTGVRTLGQGRVAALFLLLFCSTAAPMGFLQLQKYARLAAEAIVDASLLALNCATLVALAMLLPRSWLEGVKGRLNSILARSKRLPWLAALWVLAVTLFLNLVAFDRLPRTDEVHYLFQAKTFALGHLYALAPGGGVDGALQPGTLMFVDGKMFSMFPPGWPAALALGVALGVPFLVNPLIAALTVPVSHAFASRWASPRLATLITLLLVVSPWFLGMGASMFSHPLTLLLTLSAWLLMLTEGRRRPLAWFAAGCLLGWLFLTRPVDGLMIGVLTGFWALTRVDLKAVAGWTSMLVYSAGCAAAGSLIFFYNLALTGDALQTPINLYFDSVWHRGANRLGFGSDIGSPNNWGGLDIWPGHNPLEALIAAQFNLKALNVELLGWSVGSLILLYVHLLWGRLTRADWCMLAVIAATVGVYALYWFNGAFDIGPRYWFILLWPSIFLSARGLQTCSGLFGNAGIADFRERIAVLSVLLTAAALLSFLPWRATGRYWGARGAHSVYREFVAHRPAENALFFVKGGRPDYANAFALNSPDLTGPIFVRDQGDAVNAQVMARYSGRRAYMISSSDLRAGKQPIRLR